MPSPGCFDREQIDAYLDGTLPETEMERVRQHLADCPQCRAIVEDLEKQFDSMSSNLAGLLRRPVPVAEYLDEPEFQRALAKADALRHEVSFFPTRQAAGSPIQDPPHPEQLGQYQLLEPLGRGGMGTVYKALHTKLRREVALKILPPERMDDAGSAARFLREMEAVGELDHPNIIRATDAAEVDGTHFLVMELVQGVDLHKLVATCGPLATADACELIRQAAVGLEHAHEHGMVHRDIKPSNLILTSDGMVKVLDLGLARLRGSPAESQELTESGQMMGTLDYMAPEQADDAHTVDIRADIYSLGCTLYKLLTGHAPFSGSHYDRPIRKMMAHAQKSPPPVRQHRSDVPEGLQKVIDRLLAKDPADRYATPGAVADALGPFTAGCNLSALIAKAMASPTSGLEAEGARPADAESVSLATVSTDSGSEAEVVSASVGEAAPGREPEAKRVAAPIATEPQGGRFSRQRVVAIAITLLLLIGGAILLPQIIIRIRSPDGRETEITVSDADQVEVVSDGKVVAKIRTGKTDDVPQDAMAADLIPKAVWQPGPADDVLPGLIPRPARLPGIGRWQVESVEPRTRPNCVAWSPDGALLAFGAAAGHVRIYDAKTFRLVRLLIGHTMHVSSVAWSPDGKQLASASLDTTARLWSADGKPGPVLRGHTRYVNSIVWCPDGRRLASGGNDGTVRLWKVDGASEAVLQGHKGNVWSVAWSPDGKMLASGSQDKTVRLWKSDGSRGATVEGHSSPVMAVAWSPDGQTLASTDRETLRLWNIEGPEDPVTERHISKVSAEEGFCFSLAWSPDGKRLASCHWDDEVEFWDAEGTLAKTWDFAETVTSLAWSEDGKQLAVAHVWGMEVRSTEGTSVWLLEKLPNTVNSVSWRPDGRRLASTGGNVAPKGRDDWTVQLWSADGKPEQALKGHKERVWSVAWNPDGKWLASASRSVRLWHADGSPGPVFLEHTDSVRSVAWAPDSKQLASASDDNTVRLWGADGAHGPVLEGHTNAVKCVSWSPDGRQLASGSADQTIRLWSRDGTPAEVLQAQDEVWCLAWNPLGSDLGFVGATQRVEIWEPSRPPRTVLTGPEWHTCLAWSPDAKHLAVGRGFLLRGICLCRVDGIPGLLLEGHQSHPFSLAWNPDGKRLASGSDDCSIRLWDVETGETDWVGVFLKQGKIASFNSAGQILHIDPGGENHLLYVVENDSGQLELLGHTEFHDRVAAAMAEKPERTPYEAIPLPLTIRPEPLDLRPGDPLSPLALVSRPASIKGVRSWTIETRRPRGGNIRGVKMEMVAYSPDGRLLATAGEDGTIRLWDPSAGRLVHALLGHDGQVFSIAWSPDGKTLASASSDRTVRVWHADSGQMLRSLRGHESEIYTVAWSPDGKTLASGDAVQALLLWDVELGAVREMIESPAGAIRCVTWSPDGKTLASGGGDHTVRLWDANTGRLLRKLEGHTGDVNSVAWSPDGETLASGGARDNTVRVWKANSGELTHTIDVSDQSNYWVAWSPDGRMLAYQDGNALRLWRAKSGQVDPMVYHHSGGVLAGSWSPDCKTLASAVADSHENVVRIWEVASGRLLGTLEGHRNLNHTVTSSPDGKLLATGSDDGRIRLWRISSGELLRTLLGHTGNQVMGLAWSPDGRTLASAGSSDRTVRLWDPESGHLRKTLKGHADDLTFVEWSPDGKSLASSSFDKTVRLWSGDSGELLRTLEGLTDRVYCSAWSPDGKVLAAAGEDGTVRLWNAESGKLLQTMLGPGEAVVHTIAWSPNDEVLACGYGNKQVWLWDTKSGQVRQKLAAHTDRVGCLAWARDCTTLVSAGQDGTVRFWDPESGRLRRTIQGPSISLRGPVLGGFSPDGRFVVGGYPAIRVWETETGRPLGTMLDLENEHWLTISPEGHYHGSPGVESEIVYVAQTDQGQETLTPAEFAKRHGWKNDPQKVASLLGAASESAKPNDAE